MDAPPTLLAGSEGPALRLSGVTKVFGDHHNRTVALSNVDLDVAPGEFVTVVGASGCGKSTMLNLVAGLEQPTEGTINVSGQVAFMFQEATLLPWMTARRNVELALQLHGVPRSERPDRGQELLDLVRLGNAADKRPHELSGGMRQRVALARVLAQEASVVLMDEPLGALDAMTRDHMHDEIERIWEKHRFCVLFVTHNMREAIRLADRVVLMSSSPGQVKLDRRVTIPRPRRIDSAEVAGLASELTEALRAEVAAHVR
ncbi:MAG TPA: ABC transporter ATP-binding protein [Actinomycetes bacterium]|nr:ABC transporter ATP-binding protein [Actinomycetes bacterium]